MNQSSDSSLSTVQNVIHQDPKLGEIDSVWVRTPFESLEFVFRNNRTIHS